MDLGTAHVVAAAAALVLGTVVLVRRKGDGPHVVLGWVYLVAMLAVSVPVLCVYDMTGGPGPFHVLAVVSLVTTGQGWSAVRRRGRTRSAVEAHGTFMVWSWVGVVTAGLAQLAKLRLAAGGAVAGLGGGDRCHGGGGCRRPSRSRPSIAAPGRRAR